MDSLSAFSHTLHQHFVLVKTKNVSENRILLTDFGYYNLRFFQPDTIDEHWQLPAVKICSGKIRIVSA